VKKDFFWSNYDTGWREARGKYACPYFLQMTAFCLSKSLRERAKIFRAGSFYAILFGARQRRGGTERRTKLK